jgi:hypothetical protein
MNDDDAVGNVEIVGFRRFEGMVEQGFEGRAVDARIERGVGPGLRGPFEILGLGTKREKWCRYARGIGHGKQYSFGRGRV